MNIQILGTGCPKCRALEANVRTAVKQLNLQATVEKVTDIDEIMQKGVMMTPALLVDGAIKSVGSVLSTEKVTQILSMEI